MPKRRELQTAVLVVDRVWFAIRDRERDGFRAERLSKREVRKVEKLLGDLHAEIEARLEARAWR